MKVIDKIKTMDSETLAGQIAYFMILGTYKACDSMNKLIGENTPKFESIPSETIKPIISSLKEWLESEDE